jgi:hypothetical protein
MNVTDNVKVISTADDSILYNLLNSVYEYLHIYW